MTWSTETRMERSLASNGAWLFLSPHLDDAVLSCGALMEAEAAHRQVLVATLFTNSTAAPHTRAARSFLRQCDAADADTLFDARRSEDIAVLRDMGVDFLHLGAPDALFRRRNAVSALARLGRALPELVHRYPTYRFDISLGRISRGDSELIDTLRSKVAALIAESNAELIFCPVGVGRHVDHLITRRLGEDYPDQVVYYSDFPYNVAAEPDRSFIRRKNLHPWEWHAGTETKHGRIRQYATQADALFTDGCIPAVPESYYL
jgi:LmbE family N-acetylglucosaminyl deacetylase